MVSQASSVLLILADGRFPAGGHAHSGGLEQAVMSGRVRDVEDLFTYLVGRLVTMGRTDAALAALCWSAAPSADDVSVVQAEAVARAPSPALREASMAQGRSLLRAAAAVWPEAKLGWPPELAAPWAQGPMYPVALGAVGKGAGLGLEEVALVAARERGERVGVGLHPAPWVRPICGCPMPRPTRSRSGGRGGSGRQVGSGRSQPGPRRGRITGSFCTSYRDRSGNSPARGGVSVCFLTNLFELAWAVLSAAAKRRSWPRCAVRSRPACPSA